MNSPQKEALQPEISGYLQIKRERYWAQRYVEINAGVLFYYKSKGTSFYSLK